MANNIDPDQMPYSLASDLDLHCLDMSVRVLRINMVVLILRFSGMFYNFCTEKNKTKKEQQQQNKRRYYKLFRIKSVRHNLFGF